MKRSSCLTCTRAQCKYTHTSPLLSCFMASSAQVCPFCLYLLALPRSRLKRLYLDWDIRPCTSSLPVSHPSMCWKCNLYSYSRSCSIRFLTLGILDFRFIVSYAFERILLISRVQSHSDLRHKWPCPYWWKLWSFHLWPRRLWWRKLPPPQDTRILFLAARSFLGQGHSSILYMFLLMVYH